MADTEKLRTVSNSANAGPGAWRNERLLVVPGFEPTKQELLQLVRYWERIALDIRFFWFLSAQVSSMETRELLFAKHRINRIAQAIGDDVVRKAVEEVWEAFGEEVGPRAWDIFLHGDRKQIEAFQDELREEWEMREPSIEHEVQEEMAWEMAWEPEMRETSIEHEEQERMALEMIEEERMAREMEPSTDSADGGGRQA